jgi:hypothetical protein
MLLDAGSIKSNKPQPSLELVDTEITSPTVETLLHIIHRADPGACSNDESLQRLAKAYSMANKWDCQPAIQVIRLTLKCWIVEGGEGAPWLIDFFRLAAIINDDATAALAIHHGTNHKWNNPDSGPEGCLYGADLANPSAWSWEFSLLVPRQYLRAYSKAWEERCVGSKGKVDYEELSKGFLVIMAAVEGKSA